ncbi:MAG TPA: glycosyltransferase [Novimethylophilus sp.]|uniref:glycosyltransferase n=1 Tax=Novimethylophilus sp. TaxID=2137426 RepID=UPI002F40B6C5
MCHRTGFTAKTLYWALVSAGFAEVLVQRDGFSLWATAYKQRPKEPKALAGVDVDVYRPSQADQVSTYYHVWQEQHRSTVEQKILSERRIAAWPFAPRAHLAILATKQDDQLLAATIGSLARQYHMPARITVVATFEPAAEWQNNERLCWHVARGDLLQEANRVLLEFDADWVGYADAGDQFAPHALFSLAEASLSHPAWQVIYSDEDRINNVGMRELPHFKPDFNPALLRSYPYIGGLMLLEAKLFRQLEGFDAEFTGVEEHDLVLRAYERVGAAAFGHVADVLYHRLTDGGHCNLPVSELIERGRAAVATHLKRLGISAEVTHGIFPASYRVRIKAAGEISVSVLIVADAGLAHLQRCVESVLDQTSWANYEMVVLADAGAADDVRNYVAALGNLGEPRIRALLVTEDLGWAESRNRLAAEALGEYVVFLQAECAVLQADWIEELLGRAAQPGVVAVGPRLLRPDGKVSGAGAILGLYNQPVASLFVNAALDYPSYYGRALLDQNFSALTGACLMLHHADFRSAGGFGAAFSDDLAAADLCLRLTRNGDRVEWTPFVNVLYAGDDKKSDTARWGEFYARWLPKLALDSAYNPNLSLRSEFAVEPLAPLTFDPYPWKPIPRILVNPADDTGSGEYRISAPARALNQGLMAQMMTSRSTMSPPEMERVAPDVLVLQRQVYEHQVEAIRRYKKYSRAFLVFELDDLITDLPQKSALRPYMPADVGLRLAEALKLCDRFVVSTAALAEIYGHLHSDIRVVPNYLETARWQGLLPSRGAGRKPRVGWAGGNSHTGDLEIIIEVVKTLADEVEWVFFGMCIEEIQPYAHEVHAGVELDQYPAKLASLNLDLALAPLELHPFNECKSHLKLLEYGVLGYPVIATDIRPYQGDYPVTLVRNTTQEWIEAIREHVVSPELRVRHGDALRKYVMSSWMLEDNLEAWLKAWLP